MRQPLILNGSANIQLTISYTFNIVDFCIIRIRDDCPVFNPVKQLELYSEDDTAHHLGLRMIASMAKEFKYTNIMKLNNLLIKV